ncbi:MAG: ABC transporter ATP-binding protein [Patescibacteria group bacterium]
MRPYIYHISTNNAEKIKIFNRGVYSVYDATNEVILNMLKNFLLCIGFIVLCFTTSPVVTITLLIVIPIVFILPIVLGTKAHVAQKSASDKWDQVYARAGDSMLNVLVVKLFTRIGFDVSELESRVRTAALAQRKVSVYWAFLEAGGQAIHLLISLAVMLASLYFYSRGIIGLGDIVLFVAVSGKLTGPFLQLEASYRNLVRFAADYAKYREVLDAPSETDDGTKEFHGIQKELTFENASFVYPNTERKVLSDVNLAFVRGTKTALVGHTGSGKSTLASLLSRFYDPISGSIRADGVDLREFSLESFRGKIAAVFQDTTLFNDTLVNNLGYVREGITLDQIKQACADANVLEFIESLPEGFETMVGERGLKLSGGEKQRIAIARAILANPEILILDEATSALDSKTEKLVSDALEKLMAGRTSIIIAHRLSTIQHADKIYLLEQ